MGVVRLYSSSVPRPGSPQFQLWFCASIIIGGRRIAVMMAPVGFVPVTSRFPVTVPHVIVVRGLSHSVVVTLVPTGRVPIIHFVAAVLLLLLLLPAGAVHVAP